jgi:hypothetical protein
VAASSRFPDEAEEQHADAGKGRGSPPQYMSRLSLHRADKRFQASRVPFLMRNASAKSRIGPSVAAITRLIIAIRSRT